LHDRTVIIFTTNVSSKRAFISIFIVGSDSGDVNLTILTKMSTLKKSAEDFTHKITLKLNPLASLSS
jgi:hypothetical protein